MRTRRLNTVVGRMYYIEVLLFSSETKDVREKETGMVVKLCVNSGITATAFTVAWSINTSHAQTRLRDGIRHDWSIHKIENCIVENSVLSPWERGWEKSGGSAPKGLRPNGRQQYVTATNNGKYVCNDIYSIQHTYTYTEGHRRWILESIAKIRRIKHVAKGCPRVTRILYWHPYCIVKLPMTQVI